MDVIRKLFTAYKSVADEKTGKAVEQAVNILEHFDASNTEGVDPTNVRVFETAHPHPVSDYTHSERFEVARAIGYLVEIDPRSRILGSASLLIKSREYNQVLNPDFGTSYEIQGRSGGSAVRNNEGNTAFFVMGQSLVVDFRVQGRSHRRGPEGDDANAMLTRWGVRLSVKPLLGTPSYRSRPQLKTQLLQPVSHRINGDLYSWFQLLNLIAYAGAALAQALTAGDLISLQTDGEMATGAGIFSHLGKQHMDTLSELSLPTTGKQP